MLPPPESPLAADRLIRIVRDRFKHVPDTRTEPTISLRDALLSGFALFFLKSPSLLAFERERTSNTFNLQALFGLKQIPCDTQMRTILDDVDPRLLRPAFTDLFRHLQRGKYLERFVSFRGHDLLASDGTTHYSSDKIHCPRCLQKRSRNGVVSYHHRMLGMALVHPDFREVVPLCPEPIIQQDGTTKGDGERSASARALKDFRREHPKRPVIIVEDALRAEGPHVRILKPHRIPLILSVKPGKQTHLFAPMNQADEDRRQADDGVREPMAQDLGAQMDQAEQDGRVQVLTLVDPDGTVHHDRWLTDAALNKTYADERVGMLDYWELGGRDVRHFRWITDLELTAETVSDIARGGRARWRIENETFNTLKNRDYAFEHNFGHGRKHLATVFALLMMLAFLVDQAQQIGDGLFQALWAKMGSKRRLWKKVQSLFECFHFPLLFPRIRRC
ncbi:transposase [Fimbriiglobus ruber]|uniref:Transposase IS4-like domain-containing protein n=1 Tax=Fimbriiglobus ruber TaxID=1908690 RepID=A0A225DZS6_9BACT|nr:transposase [Fimbriiglobus ruber]OWK43266.1 hypothetical protein FRUB_02865 [Fimbriiglobus ruber]